MSLWLRADLAALAKWRNALDYTAPDRQGRPHDALGVRKSEPFASLVQPPMSAAWSSGEGRCWSL